MAKKQALPAYSSQPVTIYVNSGQSQSDDPQSSANLFVSKEVDKYQLKNLKSYLKDNLRRSTSLNRVLIIVICADSSEPWLLEALSSYMGGLPLRLFNYVNLQGRGQSAAAMPYHDNDEENFTFLLNYPSTNSSHRKNRTPALEFEDQNVSFQGLAALILPSTRLEEHRSPDEPLIILYMASLSMLPLIENHWGGMENAWRMTRLLQCPLWLYIDLLQACSHWFDVWEVAGHDLARRNAQAYREASRSSTLQLTRRLHKATSNVITLRENLRLQISSTERFQEYIQGKRYHSLSMPQKYQITLIERTGDLLQDLLHHWETSGVILEQFKSLMSLVFNTETVSQGQAVARLNLLAFAFLPLSFVTGIFGMTTWTISAIWYPLWAFVALGLLTTAAFIVGKISVEDQNGSSFFSRLHWGSAQNRTADVESRSIQRFPASAAMGPTAVVTMRVPPSISTQTSLERTGTYRRNHRGSRRARRQGQRAGNIVNAPARESYQPHGSPQATSSQAAKLVSSSVADEESLGEFRNDDPAQPSAPLSSAPQRARDISDGHSAGEIDHLSYVNDTGEPDMNNHMAFKKGQGRSARVTIEPHDRRQQGLNQACDPYAEAAEMGSAVISPLQIKRRRYELTSPQGTIQRGLDMSVYEAQNLRNPELVASNKDNADEQKALEEQAIQELIGPNYRVSDRVGSKRHGTYRVGMGMTEAMYTEADPTTLENLSVRGRVIN